MVCWAVFLVRFLFNGKSCRVNPLLCERLIANAEWLEDDDIHQLRPGRQSAARLRGFAVCRKFGWFLFQKKTSKNRALYCMDVSINSGIPKSSILNRVFHYKPSVFWCTTVFGNTQIIIHSFISLAIYLFKKHRFLGLFLTKNVRVPSDTNCFCFKEPRKRSTCDCESSSLSRSLSCNKWPTVTYVRSWHLRRHLLLRSHLAKFQRVKPNHEVLWCVECCYLHDILQTYKAW